MFSECFNFNAHNFYLFLLSGMKINRKHSNALALNQSVFFYIFSLSYATSILWQLFSFFVVLFVESSTIQTLHSRLDTNIRVRIHMVE